MRAAKPFFYDRRKADGGVADWLLKELNQYLRDLYVTLNRGLTPDRNFLSFSAEFDADLNEEVKIQNQLSQIPNEWVTIDAIDGGPLVRGATEWTTSSLYLKNIGPDGSFRVRFYFTGTR